MLHVTNVDTTRCSADTLATLFGVYGDVKKVKVLVQREAALVQFAYPAMAFYARKHLEGCPLYGRALGLAWSPQVRLARTLPPHPWSNQTRGV